MLVAYWFVSSRDKPAAQGKTPSVYQQPARYEVYYQLVLESEVYPLPGLISTANEGAGGDFHLPPRLPDAPASSGGPLADAHHFRYYVYRIAGAN